MRTKKVWKSRQTFRYVGTCANGHASDMRALRDVRNPSVIVAQSRKFFSTLCEIPTGYIPSGIPSVIVAQSRKLFSTLYELPTGYILSVKPSIFLIFLCIPVTKSWMAILQHTQHNNKSWPLKKNKYFMFQNITL